MRASRARKAATKRSDTVDSTWRCSRPSMRSEAPEAQCGVHSLRSAGVERDHCGQSHCTAQRMHHPDLMARRVIPDHQMRAVVGVAPCDVAGPVRRRDRRCLGRGRRRCQDNNGCQRIGVPEDCRFICALTRVRQEIATPNVRRHRRSEGLPGLRRLHRQPGSPRYGGEIPRRGPGGSMSVAYS